MNDGSRNETRIPFVYGGVVQAKRGIEVSQATVSRRITELQTQKKCRKMK